MNALHQMIEDIPRSRLSPRIEHALDRARQLAGDRAFACLLHGSSARDAGWPGSDINVAVVIDLEDGDCHQAEVPSVTSYLHEDITRPSPRIESWYDGRSFLRIEVLPRALLDSQVVYDWILADCLFGARFIAGQPDLVAGPLAQVRAARFQPAVRARRTVWYVARAREYIAGAARAHDPADRDLGHYIAAMFLSYATLERAAIGKGSYKRLPHILRSAAVSEPAAKDVLPLLDVDRRDQRAAERFILESCRAVTIFRSFAYDLLSDGFCAERIPATTRYTLISSLQLGGDNLPYGKGVVENLACGDAASALDSLRKTMLWLLLVSAHIGCSRRYLPFDRHGLLSFATAHLDLPETAGQLLARLWQNHDPTRADRLLALCDTLVPPARLH